MNLLFKISIQIEIVFTFQLLSAIVAEVVQGKDSLLNTIVT